MKTRRLALFFRAAAVGAGAPSPAPAPGQSPSPAPSPAPVPSPAPSPSTPPAANAIWYTVVQNEGQSYDFGSSQQWARFGSPGAWTQKLVSGVVPATQPFFSAPDSPGIWREMQSTDIRAKSLFVKLMTIGDSITGFYTPPLRDAIWNQGFNNVCFVGNAPTGYRGGGFPLCDNNAYGGYKFGELTIPAGQGVTAYGNNHDASDIGRWMVGQAPDIALLHLGSNDGGDTQSVANVLTAHTLLVTALRAQNPNVRIFAARIIPQVTDTLGLADPKRSQLTAWAAVNTTTASPITIVDQYTGFNQNTMLRDYVHPNDAGIAQMNATWLAAISPYLNRSSIAGGTLTAGGTPITVNGVLITLGS